MRSRPELLLALALGCGPLVMIPGGELSGTPKPVPADWSFSDAVETVQLETRPADPYSVNVWGVGMGSRFYVVAADPDTRWAAHVAEDPRVRLRVGEDLYELRAVRAEDPAELDAFVASLQKKYDYEVDKEQRAQAVFRLEPR